MSQARTIRVAELARALAERNPGDSPAAGQEWRRFGYFLELADDPSFDINPLAAAVMDSERIIWACSAVRSPGRTSLIMLAPLPADRPAGEQARAALDAMIELERKRDVALVQVLLPPAQQAEAGLLLDCGFLRLAELIYLQGAVPVRPAATLEWAHLTAQPYSPPAEPIFASVIKASYEKTLDCPELEGRRRMEDVLAGHRGSGVFRPDLWFLFRRGDQPTGVVLLNEVVDHTHQAVELVYMGLVPDGRGQGLGRAMFAHALAAARQAGYRRVLTAVDSRNVPAIRLYCGQGMSETGRRVAFIKS